MTTFDAAQVATHLNRTCSCISLDDTVLGGALERAGQSIGLSQLVASHPHLFSRTAVFVAQATLDAMAGVVAAVERIAALPAYQEQALSAGHPHARVAVAARGAFMGFDFHVSDSGPQLIEINTNAGGALLNALLRVAQRACCEPVARSFGMEGAQPFDFMPMFEREWRLSRGERPLGRIAIVDDDPETQYLYPEFVLFQRAAEARGIACIIADARQLEVADGQLRVGGEAIDLVYNRLTDFWLDQPEHAALAEAYARDLVVVTPNPRAYALYADKRRLAVLGDARALREIGADAADAELLARHVPRTIVVSPEQREMLWRERKQLFFKPQTGYGSKAAYRGDKITKGAFEQVLEQAYVAQAFVPPSSRTLQVESEIRELKLDVRCFAYAGQVQLVCARLYHGQTTNFRSAGGGFAPVYAV